MKLLITDPPKLEKLPILITEKSTKSRNMELLITDLLNSRKIGKITHTHYEKLRNTHYQYTAVPPSSFWERFFRKNKIE